MNNTQLNEAGNTENGLSIAGQVQPLVIRWQPIEKAPVDGTVIQARIPGNGSDNLIFWLDGLIDTDGNDCGGWAFTSDQEPPDCWTDGICWEVNEDGRKSIMPTHWKPYNENVQRETRQEVL